MAALDRSRSRSPSPGRNDERNSTVSIHQPARTQQASRALGTELEIATASSIPPGLVHALRNGKCMVYVGAGFSINAGTPDFEGLLQMLCQKVDPDFEAQAPAHATYSSRTLKSFGTNAKALSNILKEKGNKGLDEVQFDLYRVLGYDIVRQAMSELFIRSDEQLSNVPATYDRQRRALLKLNFQVAATWNFDNLLEGELTGVPLVREYDEDTMWRDACGRGKSKKIYKLNGSVSAAEDEPLHAIFGREDYEHMEETRRRFHQQAAERHCILTVGLRVESEETPYNPLGCRWGLPGGKENSTNEHYIILPLKAGDSSSDDFKRIQAMQASYNARVITFPLFDKDGRLQPDSLSELLERIQDEVASTAISAEATNQ